SCPCGRRRGLYEGGRRSAEGDRGSSLTIARRAWSNPTRSVPSRNASGTSPSSTEGWRSVAIRTQGPAQPRCQYKTPAAAAKAAIKVRPPSWKTSEGRSRTLETRFDEPGAMQSRQSGAADPVSIDRSQQRSHTRAAHALQIVVAVLPQRKHADERRCR